MSKDKVDYGDIVVTYKQAYTLKSEAYDLMKEAYQTLERKLEIAREALNNLIKDAKHHQSLHGKNPKKAYSMGRSDTFQWIKECAEEALKQLEEK